MVALVIVVFDERFNLDPKIAGQEVVLQRDAVLERLMPPFDLALRLWMEWRTANMARAVGLNVIG